MTIDEAIEKYKKIANSDTPCPRYCMLPCDKCVDESKQLVEWLEELKKYKENEFNVLKEDGQLSYKQGIIDGYNKAIDDFAEKICEILEEYQTGFNMVSMANVWHFSRELAEQLKAGVNNES